MCENVTTCTSPLQGAFGNPLVYAVHAVAATLVETLPPREQGSDEEGRAYAELFASSVAVRLSHRAADDERRLETLEPELSVRIIDPPE